MDLRGIGVSVIEASVTQLAREVMHVQLRQVRRALTTALKNVILSMNELSCRCTAPRGCNVRDTPGLCKPNADETVVSSLRSTREARFPPCTVNFDVVYRCAPSTD